MAKKILLVDDAAFMRKMLKDTLSKNGYTDLYEAVDGADAVEKYDELKRKPCANCESLQSRWEFERSCTQIRRAARNVYEEH